MTTMYAIHKHESPSQIQGFGPIVDEVLELVPTTGRASYWAMPECVGSFEPVCTYCGTGELGEALELGTFDTEDEALEIIRRLMGERFGYNDRLRSNAAYALRAAMGGNVV